MKKLQVLKFRGVCGIVLPAFSFNGGLPALGSLTALKTLVSYQTGEFINTGIFSDL